MKPIVFQLGPITIYGYGLMIMLGIIAGVWYLAWQGKRELKFTFDQANTLFILLFIAAIVGGKAFLILEDPSGFLSNPKRLLTGSGFVFYGSFLFAVPVMLYYFRKQKLPVFAMLDIMAGTTCLVHAFGRIGCFLAGCCYGVPTDNFLGVIFTDPQCKADPKGIPLHPTQLYESAWVFGIFIIILIVRKYRKFYGQLFFIYLILYAVGRFIIENYRADGQRGLLFNGLISHSQLIAVLIVAVTSWFYIRYSSRNKLSTGKVV